MEKERKIQILQDVVRIKSINDNEKEVAEYLQKLFEEVGIETELVEYSPTRANLVATYKGKEDGKVLGYSGHMDVVKPGDDADWKYPPFEAHIDEEGRLFGRGATDMKAGTVALALAMIELKEEDTDFNGTIKFMGTVGEEVGAFGSKQLADEGYADDLDGLVIGEPTGPEAYVTTHKGLLNYKITAHGKSSHSSMPAEGINAINVLNEFILRVNKAMDEQSSKVTNGMLGVMTHAITLIEGGDQINSIPAQATAEANIRTLPEFNNGDVQTFLEDLVKEINQELDSGELTIEFTQNNVAVEKPKNSDLVKTFQKAISPDYDIIGISPTTDAAKFVGSKADFDLVIHGPGVSNLPHQVNEYVSVDEYLEFVERYKKVALEYLK